MNAYPTEAMRDYTYQSWPKLLQIDSMKTNPIVRKRLRDLLFTFALKKEKK